MKIKKVEPTFYYEYKNGATLYFRKMNQYRDTMGWYNPIRNEIGIVNQYNWLKNVYIFIHEFLHYLNNKVSIFLNKFLDEFSDKIMCLVWKIK